MAMTTDERLKIANDILEDQWPVIIREYFAAQDKYGDLPKDPHRAYLVFMREVGEFTTAYGDVVRSGPDQYQAGKWGNRPPFTREQAIQELAQVIQLGIRIMDRLQKGGQVL